MPYEVRSAAPCWRQKGLQRQARDGRVILPARQFTSRRSERLMRPSAEFFGTFWHAESTRHNDNKKKLENRLKVNSAVKLNLYLYHPRVCRWAIKIICNGREAVLSKSYQKKENRYRDSLRWAILGLNQGPPDYESVALTNWAKSPCISFWNTAQR